MLCEQKVLLAFWRANVIVKKELLQGRVKRTFGGISGHDELAGIGKLAFASSLESQHKLDQLPM